MDIISNRSKLNSIVEDINTSVDPYIRMRSFYIQNRRKNNINQKFLYDQEEKEFENLLK